MKTTRPDYQGDYVCFDGYCNNRRFIAGMLKAWRRGGWRAHTTSRPYYYNELRRSRYPLDLAISQRLNLRQREATNDR